MPDTTSDMLAHVAAERTRGLAPIVLGLQCFALAVSEGAGIEVGTSTLVYNAAAVTLLAVIAYCAWLRKLGPMAHYALAALWLVPIGGTIISALHTSDPRLLNLVVIELVCVAVFVNTLLAVGAASAAVAAYAPLITEHAPDTAALSLSMLLSAAGFGVLLQLLVRRSLIRAELLRISHAKTAAELSQRIEEVERAEDERARLQERVLHAQRLEAVATLARGLAHDVNNVLAAIASHASVLHADGTTDSRAVETILDQVERGAELTRGVLAYSRQGNYRKSTVYVSDLLGDAIPALEPLLPPSCVLDVQQHTRRSAIEVDLAQMSQVVVNVCSNAADAMPNGGHIVIATRQREVDAETASVLDIAAGSYVELAISDTGIGMAEETKRRVFEPFFTTKPRGAGTGLGLAMAWGVVRGHGGAIELASQVGHGTRVAILLPETRRAPTPLPLAPQPADIICPGTVLVIDDEPAVRNGTRRLLARRGYRVFTAENGADGLAVFEEHASLISVVVLDMNMPVMGGAELFFRLREQSDVPVVVATGYAADDVLQAMIARGALVVEKPFTAPALLDAIARSIALRHHGAKIPRQRDTPGHTPPSTS